MLAPGNDEGYTIADRQIHFMLRYDDTMTMNPFIIHGCEQVLRFSRAQSWNDLSEERKVQLGFNMGVMALGLQLSKEEGYLTLAMVREGSLSIQEFHTKMRALISLKNIPVNETNVHKPF